MSIHYSGKKFLDKISNNLFFIQNFINPHLSSPSVTVRHKYCFCIHNEFAANAIAEVRDLCQYHKNREFLTYRWACSLLQELVCQSPTGLGMAYIKAIQHI